MTKDHVSLASAKRLQKNKIVRALKELGHKPRIKGYDDKIKIGLDGCIYWIKSKNSDGYGNVGINKKVYKVFKVVYEHLKGKTPKGYEIDHICRNRACINPKHLRTVTHRENMRNSKVGKLKSRDVEKIRKMKGKKTQRDIGKIFGVSHTLVGDIHNNKKWND